MANKVEIELTTKVKELGDKVSGSSMSRKEKDLATAGISEVLNILGKGVRMTGQDFNRVSSILREITQNLVKAAAGSAQFVKGLNELQQKLEVAVKARNEARSQRISYERSKVIVDANKNITGLRGSELNRLVKESHITNTKGGEYTTYKAVEEAASKGVQSAIDFLRNVLPSHLTKVTSEYSKIVQEELAQGNVIETTTKDIEQLEQTKPESEVAVKAQTFGNELQNLVDAIKEAYKEIKEGTNKEQETEEGVSVSQIEEFSKLPPVIDKTTGSLGKAFKQFTLYAIALRSIKKAVREAVVTVKELDRALTEQAMVTGLTRKQTYGLLKDYQEMASGLGATTKEVSSTMTQFLRQGRSINESLKLTEAAVSAAKVAGISAADSINYLTTAINGFRLSADDAMKVSDKFAAVAASAATSYEEIAIALSKVAAQANLAGMSIDYTTALLTKGIETTREAPETIGTALKTVIARMRELGDYGETLEGDTDVNNVETQLAYIGIQLRDNNGELRSTEDVLNELGGQWDELNANQQAAIAKALAGTRQQSRLIAMMQDYERVTELQEIASRSAGATMAQMATYLEGMDAALNRVSVAWEKIVSSVVDSDIIINLINIFANVVENLGEFLSTQEGIITGLITISVIGVTILGNKMREIELAKLQQKYNLQQEKAQLQSNINKTKELLITEKTVLAQKKEAKAAAEAARQQLFKEKSKARELGDYNKLKQINLDIVQNSKDLQQYDAEIEKLETEITQEESKLKIYEKQDVLLKSQDNLINKIGSGITGFIIPLMAVIKLWQVLSTTINRGIITATALKKKENIETQKGTLLERTKAAWEMAGSAANIPVVGWVIAAAILAAVGIAIGVAAANMAKSNKTAADSISDMSAEIYNLNKKSTELQSVIDKFDDLDKKVIKTNKDLEEMNTLLESAGDSLTEEEKAEYQKLQTNAGRRQKLDEFKEKTDLTLQETRDRQRNAIIANQQSILSSRNAQQVDSVYALNNATLYAVIDNTEDLNDATEKLVQTLLEELTLEQALALVENPDKINDYIKSVQNGIEVFTDEEKSIKERARAYEELAASIDKDLLPALQSAYSEWDRLAKLSDQTLDWMEAIGATTSDINDLSEAMRDAGVASGEELNVLEQLVERIEIDGLKNALEELFGDKAQDMLIAYEKAFGTTLLNMGQDMDKFTNKIDSFYTKASEWSSMSNSERTAFISENGKMFEGESGQALLKAFNSGDYEQIRVALANNEALKEERALLLRNLETQLEIEKSRENVNEAYIQELELYKRMLEDEEKLYLASLKTRYDQQQKQLDMYKEMLQKENDAVIEALNKRKEAYQKYFEAINKDAEEQDFEEQVDTLVANISKLSSSTNADARAKSADLAKQLEDLEKERLKTLREQAQEAVLQSMEDEVSKISDNLEKLLNNEQALLNAMLNDNQDSSALIATLMASRIASGDNSPLGMQSYLQQMQATFASIMPDIDWSQVEVTRQGDNVILNIAGDEITLNDSEQKSVRDAIQEALRQIGYK